MKKLTIILIILTTILIAGCDKGALSTERYQTMHLKDDYCGSKYMNYKFCKCAFHGLFCTDPMVTSEAGSTQKEVKAWVELQYKHHTETGLEIFKKDCATKGGLYYDAKSQCTICKPGFEPIEKRWAVKCEEKK